MDYYNQYGQPVMPPQPSPAEMQRRMMADEARINAAIVEEEKHMNNLYFRIGKLYVAMHAADYEHDFDNMIQALRESEIRVRNYRKQIEDLKGIVHCAKCGAEVPKTSSFCTFCGTPVSKQPAADGMVQCAACGAMVARDMRFCTCCGKPLTDLFQNQTPAAPEPVVPEPAAPAAAPVAEPAPAVEPAPAAPVVEPEPVAPPPAAETMVPPPAERKCPHCGNPVDADAVFCTACGKNLAEQPAPEKKCCPGCGAPVAEGTVFCTACGMKL